MALYRITQPTFMAPNLLKEGTKIRYDGVPGSSWEPLDDEAQAAKDKLFATKPGFGVNPIDALPIVEQPYEVVSVPDPKADDVVELSVAEAATAKAQPGPTEKGGKVADIGKK